MFVRGSVCLCLSLCVRLSVCLSICLCVYVCLYEGVGVGGCMCEGEKGSESAPEVI